MNACGEAEGNMVGGRKGQRNYESIETHEGESRKQVGSRGALGRIRRDKVSTDRLRGGWGAASARVGKGGQRSH